MAAEPLDPALLRWVEQAIGARARVVSIRSMGEAQTEMHAVDVDEGGATLELVLRRYTDTARLADDPWYSPKNEATALELLEGVDIPAPALLAKDIRGEQTGIPTLLTTRLRGEPVIVPDDLDAFSEKAVAVLPVIHAVQAQDLLSDYEPYKDPRTVEVPSWSSQPELWQRVLEAVTGPAPTFSPCFIHRDFHMWNLLWDDGSLTGVVDWLTAAIGPPGIDLARMRLNLANEIGPEAAARFLEITERTIGPEGHHPYWDLLDAVDSMAFDEPPATPEEAASWTRFESYVADVVLGTGQL